MPGENSLENNIEGTQKGRYIEMGRLTIGSPNKVLPTEVLVVSDNVASCVRFTPYDRIQESWANSFRSS